MSKRAIWKFEMPTPVCTIDMPLGAVVLAFGQQNHALVVWVEADPSEIDRVSRRFLAVNTGTEYEAGFDWHGMVQMPNGLVWHLLEDGPRLDDLLPPAVD